MRDRSGWISVRIFSPSRRVHIIGRTPRRPVCRAAAQTGRRVYRYIIYIYYGEEEGPHTVWIILLFACEISLSLSLSLYAAYNPLAFSPPSLQPFLVQHTNPVSLHPPPRQRLTTGAPHFSRLVTRTPGPFTRNRLEFETNNSAATP